MNPLDQDLYNWEWVEYKPLLEHLPESGLNRHCVAENTPDSAAAGWTDLVLEWAVLLWLIQHSLSCVLVDYHSIAFMLESSIQTFFSHLLHRVGYGFYCNPLCSSHQQCREQIWDQQLKCVKCCWLFNSMQKPCLSPQSCGLVSVTSELLMVFQFQITVVWIWARNLFIAWLAVLCGAYPWH